MKLFAAALLVSGCMSEETQPDLPQPIDTIWADSIHAGDMFALVPGTDSYDYYAAVIDPLHDPVVVDVRKSKRIADDAIVIEQAIAAAHRAGIPNAQLEDGTIRFGIWGVGFESAHTEFTYVSFEGLHIPVEILGGTSKCAKGSVASNLVNYNKDNADADARDLYRKLILAKPTGNVIVASHSWGGAVAEYFAENLETIQSSEGPGPAPVFTIAMGVPGVVLNYAFKGPGLRHAGDSMVYEVDRPDDPVHQLHPGGNGGGHQYDITFGDEFIGSYGITTDQMSCEGVAGACY